MSNPLRSSLLVVGLAVLLASPVGAAPLLSDASLVCAQLPTDAAFDAAHPQITPDDPLVGTSNCANLCKKWVGACKGAVAAMNACWLKSVAKIGGVRNATCAVLDGASEESCRAIVKDERDAAKDFLKGNVETARDFCENGGLANCLLNCS